MKKRILYIAAIVICLSILSGGTLAYYTSADTARNVITSGSVKVDLIQQQMVDGVLEPYTDELVKIMPGTTVSKIVSVQNTEKPAWIRVRLQIILQDADGNEMQIPEEDLASVIIIEPDNTGWSYRDGWWYYNAPVETGETTSPLFETVSFSAVNMDNRYQGCTVIMSITAQGCLLYTSPSPRD